jgi:hypothetical protein
MIRTIIYELQCIQSEIIDSSLQNKHLRLSLAYMHQISGGDMKT